MTAGLQLSRRVYDRRPFEILTPRETGKSATVEAQRTERSEIACCKQPVGQCREALATRTESITDRRYKPQQAQALLVHGPFRC
jgi:hypothetical protein